MASNSRKIVYGLLLISIIMLLTEPELLLEFAHVVFEFIESTLDGIIEFIFETGLHQTQIIVFYILLLFISFLLYRLFRIVPFFFHGMKEDWFWLKNHATLFWQNLSNFQRVKFFALCFGVIYFLSFLM